MQYQTYRGLECLYLARQLVTMLPAVSSRMHGGDVDTRVAMVVGVLEQCIKEHIEEAVPTIQSLRPVFDLDYFRCRYASPESNLVLVLHYAHELLRVLEAHSSGQLIKPDFYHEFLYFPLRKFLERFRVGSYKILHQPSSAFVEEVRWLLQCLLDHNDLKCAGATQITVWNLLLSKMF